jgi:hypothetical protein
MSECNNKNQCNGCENDCNCGKSCCGVSRNALVRGIIALCFGLFFLGMAYRIIVRVIFFGIGLSLIYYGFRVLGITQVTQAVDSMIERIKKLFND